MSSIRLRFEYNRATVKKALFRILSRAPSSLLTTFSACRYNRYIINMTIYQTLLFCQTYFWMYKSILKQILFSTLGIEYAQLTKDLFEDDFQGTTLLSHSQKCLLHRKETNWQISKMVLSKSKRSIWKDTTHIYFMFFYPLIHTFSCIYYTLCVLYSRQRK